MPDRPRAYLDTCCFIDIVKQSVGLLPPSRNADVWFLWKMLEAHKEKDIEVFTSVLTIAECTHADGNSEQKVRELCTRLLMSGQYVTLVQPTPFIGADARDLRWIHGIALKGADALHVASGLAVKAIEFLTTDEKITGQKAKIEALGMRVAIPEKTTVLPQEYRQGEIFDDKVTTLRRHAPPSPPLSA